MNRSARSLSHLSLENWRASAARLAGGLMKLRARRSKLRIAAAASVAIAILGAILAPTMFAQQSRPNGVFHGFIPGVLAVSRVEYDGNNFGSTETFPDIFNDPTISGVQGSIFIDEYLPLPIPGLPSIGTLPLTGITTSFSSKSEGALMLSENGKFLTYMGYQGPVGAEGVSNSETPGATLTTNTAPTFNREVALISANGAVSLTPETNAYSGDNPRACISADGTQFYMAGNADSTLNADGSGPGTTIGARLGAPGSDTSIQLGTYLATDRPDESKKQHIKDNNFRGIGIFNGNLYVSKGSGGNGDDGVFQVQNGTGNGLPTGTGNTIVKLLGDPATDPTTGAASPITPFGFFFANPTTLYVADEGTQTTDASGNLLPDPMAGLQKWSLVNGTWVLDYVLQAGLNLNQAESVSGYPVPTFTTGLRNLTGVVSPDGTVTLFAITAQFSSISGGEPDPTRLVTITDKLSAKTLPSSGPFGLLEKFATIETSHSGEVFRGVAFAPCGFCESK